MIVAPIRSRSLFEGRRLDARYFTAPGVQSAERLVLLAAAGVDLIQVGGAGGVGEVEHVTRFKRVLAASSEPSLPFLRAFDVFEYLPEPADLISESRTDGLDGLRVEPGVILLTRSGRNLGPCVMADKYLSRFIPSDDLLRIRIPNEAQRLYVFAFLSTPTGQELLRLDRTGSVIDHLSAPQVARQAIPVFPAIFDQVVRLMGAAQRLQEEARVELDESVRAVEAGAGIERPLRPLRDGWTVNSKSVRSRFDAAFHQSGLRATREALLAAGGQRLGEVATVLKPPGRYKTYYVEPNHGRPMLSGRHLLQFKPIGAKYISDRSISKALPYELHPGMIAFQADGRAEESLGQPVLVTNRRDRWLASGHVGRVTPHEAADQGWIWASMASTVVRRQMSSLACGSVVDALYEQDIANIVLPPRSLVDGAAVSAAWAKFDNAERQRSDAISLLEAAVHEFG